MGEYVGGYTDWVRQRGPAADDAPAAVTTPAIKRAPVSSPKHAKPATPPVVTKKRKLTFKEAGELASLPDEIDALERNRAQICAMLADPATARDSSAVSAAMANLKSVESEIAVRTERWELLETIAHGR